MLKKYYPYAYCDSAFNIDYEKLYNDGCRGLIFDIDNTLVHHGDDSNERVDKLINFLQSKGFKTLFLTNNNEERVKRFLKNIESDYICLADKPKPDGYLKALEIMGLKKDEAVVIGDQMFTDILGANRSGIPSILVHFIQVNPNAKIGKKRYIEMLILKLYGKSKKYCNRLGKIQK